MFSGELPKLFDRNFIIGYVLPVTVIAIVTYGILLGFGLLPDSSFLSFDKENPVLQTTVTAFALWLIALFFLATNRAIYQLMEGYGNYNPLRLVAWKEKRRLKQLQKRINANEKYSPEWYELRYNRVEQFPPESHMLPTRFGNILRAFELYPWVIYGIDAVEGWNRLVAMINKDYQKQIDDAKAQTDFWLNLWVFGILALIEYAIIVIYVALFRDITEHLYMLWFLPALLLFPFLASWGSRLAALEWGNYVKSSFDVYLPVLGKQLGFPSNLDYEQEKKLWDLFRKQVTYRLKECREDFLNQTTGHTDLVRTVHNLGRNLLPNKFEAAEVGSKLEEMTQAINALQEELKKERPQLKDRE
jgi:hypothetical protein